MDELTRWADHEPTNRAFVIERQASNPPTYRVQLWYMDAPVDVSKTGVGEGLSLVFAAVRAFDDLSAKMSAE